MLRRNALAALVPAALLGAGADLIELLRHDLGAEIALGITLALIFELYVGYAELLVAADRATQRLPAGWLLRRATRFAPALLLASLAAVSLPLAAAGLLVLPGLWLATRWGVFAPAVVHEHLGPLAALARSSALVRGAFWAVAAAVTVPLLVEHAAIHATAHSAEPVLGSQVLALVVAALVTMAVSPPAAFTISLVYERLLARSPADPREGLHAEAGTPPSPGRAEVPG
jgi:hypothetical protein